MCSLQLQLATFIPNEIMRRLGRKRGEYNARERIDGTKRERERKRERESKSEWKREQIEYRLNRIIPFTEYVYNTYALLLAIYYFHIKKK